MCGKSDAGGVRAPAVIVIAAISGVLAMSQPRYADCAPIKIHSPSVTKGKNEIEYLGFRDIDKDDERDGAEMHSIAIGRGFTDYWLSELSLVYAKEPGASLEYDSLEWENLFRLSKKDQYWAEFGLFTQYEATEDGADEILIAPIVEKTVDRWVGTMNLFFGRKVGSEAESGTSFSYAARLRYSMHKQFAPAIEIFGDLGRIGEFDSFNEQEHWAGPAFYGQIGMGGSNKVVYSAAYLFGVTSVSSDNRAILRIEYEFF
ncbi:MAG TPA: hypothetical protein VJT81_00860 [Burkholderiales bacterium]|nr:hypothetical protein [Burkholderiales bacterium]